MDIFDILMAIAVDKPELIVELKQKRRDMFNEFTQTANVLSMDERKKMREKIAAMDQFIWAFDISNDTSVIKALEDMFCEAKKMADSEMYTNDDIADYCIAHSQAEIMPLFVTEFPQIYPDAKYDEMVYHMQLTLDKAYGDIDYRRLTIKEMIVAVLTAIQ